MPLSAIVQLYIVTVSLMVEEAEYTEETTDMSFFVFSIFKLCLTMSVFYLPWFSVFHLLMAFDNILVHSDFTVFKVRVYPI